MKNLVGPEDMARWPAILAKPGLIPHITARPKPGPAADGTCDETVPKGALPGEFGIQDALKLD